MTPFKLAVAAAVAAVFAFSLNVQAQSPAAQQERAVQGKKSGKAQVSKQDRQHLERLAQSDMAEIAAGKLAAEKAASPEVKKFGQHMVDEHSKMLEEGKKVAESKGVKPPANTDKKHQAAIKKLQGLSGEEFDKQFVAQMVKDHEDALKLAEKAAKDAKDPAIKAHAEKGAPHIKEHLADARKLQDSLGASAGSSGRNASPKSK
jgi:putative membrane protein